MGANSMTNSPLNPHLFQRLEDYYGDVDITNAGCENDWEVVWEPSDDGTRRVPRRKMNQPGEEYKVRCRLCRDDRARLLINHMWGVKDPLTNTHNMWLAHCFNEECYSEFEDQKRLYNIIYGLGRIPRHPKVLPGRRPERAVLQPMKMPGTMYRLDKLVERMPGHDALKYLRGRGFDPVLLGKLWGVSYCCNSRMHYARNRIIIPIYQEGMLAGWQARYIGDDVDGRPFNKAGVPKYFTSPGFHRRLTAYNLERALMHPTVVIVEGPADCWRVGPMAIGCLGKTMSAEVRQKLIEGMKRHGDDAVIVVALDPKPDKTAAAKGKPHHIERLANQLAPALPNRVVPVYLPEEYDPGSMDRQLLRQLIRDEAGKKGLKVSFEKPSG
jgi:hypothetical protein